MGLDVILYTPNSEALYQKDHDYFDEHMLSRTSCRIMFRQHTVAGGQVSKNMLFSTYQLAFVKGRRTAVMVTRRGGRIDSRSEESSGGSAKRALG
jgi:hypothetical protein